MTCLYANGWIVTMDDAGTEHRAGWLLVEERCHRRRRRW